MKDAATTDRASVPTQTAKITENAVPVQHITEMWPEEFPTVSKKRTEEGRTVMKIDGNELMKKEECLITEFLFDSLANDLSPGPRSAGLKKSFFSCFALGQKEKVLPAYYSPIQGLELKPGKEMEK